MELRVGFAGHSDAMLQLAEILSRIPDTRIAGMYMPEPPESWPPDLEVPELYSDVEEMLRREKPHLVLAAEGVKGLGELPPGFPLVRISEADPLGRLVRSLAEAVGLVDEVEREIREITTLCSGLSLAETYTDPVPKLGMLLDRAMAVLGAEIGMVLLKEESLESIEVAVVRGKEGKEMVGRKLHLESSFCGRAFDKGEMTWGDISESDEEAAILAPRGITKLIAAPVRLEGRVAGLFVLGAGEKWSFDSLHMALLSLVAGEAGMVMQLARLYREMEEGMVMDSVSRLYNWDYFNQRLDEEMQRARRYSLNLTLLLLQVDDFEGYLERNGRLLADLVLFDMGNIIRRNTREVDIAARNGGERFAVLLPETGRLGGMRLAERIRAVVEEYPFPSRERKEAEYLTVCCGVASFPAHADNREDLLRRVFAALEAARSSGPNNIRLYSPSR